MNFNGEQSSSGFQNPYPNPVTFSETVNIDGVLTLGAPPNSYSLPPDDSTALVGQVLQYQGKVAGVGQVDFVTSTGPLDNTLTSPDTLTVFTVGNAATTLTKSGHQRLDIDATKSELISPDTLTTFSVQNSIITGTLDSQIVINSDSTDTTLFDPAGTVELNLGTSIDGITIPTLPTIPFRVLSEKKTLEVKEESFADAAVIQVSGNKQFQADGTLAAIASPDNQSVCVTQNSTAALVSNGAAILGCQVNTNTAIFVDDTSDLCAIQQDNVPVFLSQNTGIVQIQSVDTTSQIFIQGSGNLALESTGGQLTMLGNNTSAAFFLSDSSGNITFETPAVAEIHGNNSGASLTLNDTSNYITALINSAGVFTADANGGHLYSPNGGSIIQAQNSSASVQSTGNASVGGTINPTTQFIVSDSSDAIAMQQDGIAIISSTSGGNVIIEPTDASSALVLATTAGNSSLQYQIVSVGTSQLNINTSISSLISPDGNSNITATNSASNVVSNGQAALFGVTNPTTGVTMDDAADTVEISQDGTTMIETSTGPVLKVFGVSYPSTTGSAGQVLTLSSPTLATWVTPSVTPSTFSIVQQVFTSGGTYTPSANMVYVIIEGVGAGAGGGGAISTATNTAAGAGGGGGAYGRVVVSKATIGGSQPVTVNSGGLGGAGSNPGGNASASGVGVSGAILFLNGGNGGAAGTSGINTTGGIGGFSSGSASSAGGQGGSGFGNNSNILVPCFAGGGGSSYFGQGPPGFYSSSSTGGNAPASNSYGCGGTGAASFNGGGGQTGGQGSGGIIIFTEYIIT